MLHRETVNEFATALAKAAAFLVVMGIAYVAIAGGPSKALSRVTDPPKLRLHHADELRESFAAFRDRLGDDAQLLEVTLRTGRADVTARDADGGTTQLVATTALPGTATRNRWPSPSVARTTFPIRALRAEVPMRAIAGIEQREGGAFTASVVTLRADALGGPLRWRLMGMVAGRPVSYEVGADGAGLRSTVG
ncbi:hypothetical protein [Conexibacter sp. SYSU D00693]|uniref:hypothetical protein n=1 Tax=Conexibacter sp. SYSU D00693 TaxID=2812560 RepID=UPI00196AAC3D|nr:hypothetical protein [Conexibacter sp. SYSU D00693]